MPPRKTPTADGEELAPRRSTRISSQSGVEAPKETETKATSKAKPAAKRSAEDDSESSSKKVKADSAEEDGDSEAAQKLAPIDIGDSLPSLILKNEKDEDVEVSTLAAEKGVVFFLVPKADTPGCTTQACGFRDIYPDFTSVNYEVYCLSADTSEAQSKWQSKKELPYPLLSDRKRILIGALGAIDGTRTKRSHFIFGKGGKLLDKKLPVKPADSPTQALEFIKGLSEA